MNILLIVPPVRKDKEPNRFPLGLGYVAANLRNMPNISVRILDLNLARPSDDGRALIMATVNDEIDLVLTGGMLTVFQSISSITDMVKACRPDLPVWVGGSMAAVMKEVILGNSAIDGLLAGEAEYTLPAFVSYLKGDLAGEDVPGLSILRDGRLIQGPVPDRIRSLDELPMPAYDLFDTAAYSKGQADIIASRGCPFKCKFCYRNFGNLTIKRSVDNVLAEMVYLHKHYGVTTFKLEDEIFTINRKYIKEFCKRIQEELPGVRWMTYGRVDTISDGLLQTLKAGGCYGLMMGFEWMDNDILEDMGKQITVEQCDTAARLMLKHEMKIYPGFIIGAPGETIDSVKAVESFCLRHNICINEWQYAFLTAYPGTELYKNLIRDGKIEDEYKYLIALCAQGDTKNLLNNLSPFPDNELRDLRDSVVENITNYFKKRD